MIHPRAFPALLLAALTFASVSAFGQGALTPPGAPAPTMKTLDQVEARIPFAPSAGPITADGSYYLTGDVANGVLAGIAVSANNVTLDLNGYAITAAATPGVGSSAIFYSGSGHFTVRNGSIRGATTYNAGAKTFSSAGYGYGIQATNGISVRVEHVDISGVAQAGITITGAATSATISHCQVNVSAKLGISVASHASTIDNCVVQNCGTDAITGGVVTGCYAATVGQANGIAAQNAENCYGSSDSGIGIQADAIHNCRGSCGGSNFGLTSFGAVTDSYGECSGSGYGIYAATVTNCYGGSSTGVGIGGQTIANSKGYSQDGTGISTFYLATGCRGQSSTGTGLSATTALNCFGDSSSGVGLVATAATNCTGTTGGAAATSYGLDCGLTGVATGCRGVAPTGTATPTALRAFIGNGCIVSGGKVTITNKYNMP